MSLDVKKFESLLKLGTPNSFKKIFIEHLGWNSFTGTPELKLDVGLDKDAQPYRLRRIAQKQGMVVCVWDTTANYDMPLEKRNKLMNRLSRVHYEHILIGYASSRQDWAVSIRPPDKPRKTVVVRWYTDQKPQLLLEKLRGILFSLDEEDGLQISDVVKRVKGAFIQNSEKVTRKFYKKFSVELKAFTAFIKGIQANVEKEWYASLMLNRLMFIYFIQRKRFLDGDSLYLENQMRAVQKKHGRDKYHDLFYREFLRRLFHEGLSVPVTKRDKDLKNLIGKIPYLNGGLFDVHQVERDNPNIQIPDEAFENLFDFFNQYNWHLDARPQASGKDINPDVLGYIFEKYINDRAEKGAYYTKEDVTGYVARNTIIPSLLQRAQAGCREAFRDHGIFRALKERPDDYIYESMKHGCGKPDECIPEEIKRGIDPDAPKLTERRKHWNSSALPEFGLPTETWRETIARRKRYTELKNLMETGAIDKIDDLITHNLDIERFVESALSEYEGADFIIAFFKAIAGYIPHNSSEKERLGLTVLDPACGSGAFLFAALEILEPLYERCLERMHGFVAADNKQGGKQGGKKYPFFRRILEDADNSARHPNIKYYIYKQIILNNLFGVDMMPEAVETTKLRLFLKLAGEATYNSDAPNLGLEPLPDIDFNIRSGNTLVGFASTAEFEILVSKQLDLSGGSVRKIRQRAEIVDKVYGRFKQAQDRNDSEYRDAKQKLHQRLAELNSELNRRLAQDYGKETDDMVAEWKNSHKPFHWFAEFYGIIEKSGGFDVIIGNPPYVKYNKKIGYEIQESHYKTHATKNLFSYFMERNESLLNDAGRTSMIVPLAAFCTQQMQPVRELYNQLSQKVWVSNYAVRPHKLFADAEQRLSIYIRSENHGSTMITNYMRWSSKERQDLFKTINYGICNQPRQISTYFRTSFSIDKNIFTKLHLPDKFTLIKKYGKNTVWYHNAPRYWIHSHLTKPYFCSGREGGNTSTHIKALRFSDTQTALSACAILNSSLFYWWFTMSSNGRDLTLSELKSFPVDLTDMTKSHHTRIAPLIAKLMKNYAENSIRKSAKGARFDEFHPACGKHIMDEIDTVLAQYYGFTEEELDYIINYDIKYRMGNELSK